MPHGEDLPEHPRASPPADSQSVKPRCQAAEQFGVTAKSGLHGGLDNGGVHHRTQVDQCPDDAGDPERPAQAAIGGAPPDHLCVNTCNYHCYSYKEA